MFSVILGALPSLNACASVASDAPLGGKGNAFDAPNMLSCVGENVASEELFVLAAVPYPSPSDDLTGDSVELREYADSRLDREPEGDGGSGGAAGAAAGLATGLLGMDIGGGGVGAGFCWRLEFVAGIGCGRVWGSGGRDECRYVSAGAEIGGSSVSAELEGGRVGGTSLVVVAVVECCCAGVGSGFSLMAPKGSKVKGSRDGSSGSAFEKRDRPGVGGARDDGSSMMDIPRFP